MFVIFQDSFLLMLNSLEFDASVQHGVFANKSPGTGVLIIALPTPGFVSATKLANYGT